MKIQIPTIRAERVGTLVSYATDRLYDCPNRPNVYGNAVEKPLIERKLVAKTVFDRDLQVGRRALGVARIALWTASLAVFLPLLVPFVVAKATSAIIDYIGDRLGDLCDAAGIRRRGIRATYSALLAQVTAK